MNVSSYYIDKTLKIKHQELVTEEFLLNNKFFMNMK